MPTEESFWDFYWETRLQPLENLGKREAILAGSRLIRQWTQPDSRSWRLLELGCGEGQVMGALLDAHSRECSLRESVGVDYHPPSVARCQQDYPGANWIQGDFTDSELLAGLGEFELVLLVNALHEVFSDCYSAELGEIDVSFAKARVEQALAGAVRCLAPGGWLVLFDGLEPSGNEQQILRIRFRDRLIRQEFENFAAQFQPFRIAYRQLDDPLCVELTQHDFTRYITKSIFLGKALWKSERLQSYQYFTEEEFRTAFARQGLPIAELRTLTMNEDKWRYRVEIETPGASFPAEHVLILAHHEEQ